MDFGGLGSSIRASTAHTNAFVTQIPSRTRKHSAHVVFLGGGGGAVCPERFIGHAF